MCTYSSDEIIILMMNIITIVMNNIIITEFLMLGPRPWFSYAPASI